MAKRNRPYWQNQPCPKWCRSRHHKRDGVPDRTHFSQWEKQFKLSLYSPKLFIHGERHLHEPAGLVVSLEQGYREVEARVMVVSEVTRDDLPALELTPAEARKLAQALTTAADIAEGRVDTITPGGATP